MNTIGKKWDEEKLPDYVKVLIMEEANLVEVYFSIEMQKPFAVGEKMNEINEQAYMNGYNWEAFLGYYLEKNHPALLEGMDTDPEAGTYAAFYEKTPENEKKAGQFAELIAYLIENEEELYKIVREMGDEIEWD